MDLVILPFCFQATVATVQAVSPAGRAAFAEWFGAGACSADFPKSTLPAFVVAATEKGLAVA